jgi:lipoyl synthase
MINNQEERKKLPDWIRIDFRHDKQVMGLKRQLRCESLHTVCEEARCPNLSECFGIKKTATFMILGDVCTRNCAFCNVNHAVPCGTDPDEPAKIASMVISMGLKHVVVTSVTRDDLPDGGAGVFAETIRAVHELSKSTIEVLTPDFLGNQVSRRTVSAAKPEIFNHNVETVSELYKKVRPQADYKRSLDFLKGIKIDDPSILTKSGIMVGLGETEDQLKKLLDDLAMTGIDIFTCGQYLRPSKNNLPVEEYRTPEWFEKFAESARSAGIKHVYASPFTRSSYNAAEIIAIVSKENK